MYLSWLFRYPYDTFEFMLKVLFVTESADSVCRDSTDVHYMVIAAKKFLKISKAIDS